MVLEFGLQFGSDVLFPSSSVSGDGMTADPATVNWTDVGIGIVPIGAVVFWFKSLTGVPSLLPSFVECNGQVLADGDSPLNGQTIPNINGSGGGTQKFLRGATTSGGTGGTETHVHANGGTRLAGTGPGTAWDGTANSNTAGTLPSYIQGVAIMRIK